MSTAKSQPRKTRTRSGCLVCRRRRRKCDELRPTCTNCKERGLACDWGMKITFRAAHATGIDEEHPSMKAASSKRGRQFQIVDVTPQIERDYGSGFPSNSRRLPIKVSDTHPSNKIASPINRIYNEAEESLHSDSASPNFNTPTSTTESRRDDISSMEEGDQCSPISRDPDVNALENYRGDEQCTSLRDKNEPLRSPVNTADAADLLALRYPPSQPYEIIKPARSPIFPIPSGANVGTFQRVNDESSLFEYQLNDQDGIFLPGSRYQEFHSTLRDHLIYTAKSNVPTRHGTPDLLDVRSRSDEIGHQWEFEPERGNSIGITPQREFVLWEAWIHEIAPWLDKFDNKRHFEHRIPIMARDTPHLKYSILALSARQIEMKQHSKSLSESLALYQQAIHFLLPELETKRTGVIASCVILCVLEMMSCSPKEWRRHLEGCANLLQAVGINGFTGGAEEALFWCFARIDLCGALISQDTTLIPVEYWASDVALFIGQKSHFDTYANYAVFLCARCCAYLKERSRMCRETDLSSWVGLVQALDDWYTQRSEEMKPILTIPIVQDDGHFPFPTVLYGNGPAVSGNQLYHTAMLLMLQAKSSPLELEPNQVTNIAPTSTSTDMQLRRSVSWHARQICAISESNSHHGAWTNSIQPIWIAGKVMSHPNEHQAILNILDRIERETGWVTSWRKDDLKAWWGNGNE